MFQKVQTPDLGTIFRNKPASPQEEGEDTEHATHPSSSAVSTEDATTTFEGWGKDTKWNTSLFHLTMSYAAVFLADVDLKMLFA